MTSAERTAKIAELRAEADRLEREGKRNWPEKVERGMMFRHDRDADGAVTYFVHRTDGSQPEMIGVAGSNIGVPTAGSLKWLQESSDEFTYIGRARDLLTIKTPDAHEPTGAELVGKVCQLSLSPINTNSNGITDTVVMYDAQRDEYHGDDGQCKPWKYARLYRKDRP